MGFVRFVRAGVFFAPRNRTNAILQIHILSRKETQNLVLYRKSAPRHILNVGFQSPGVRQLREAIRIAEKAVVQTLDDVVQMVVLCNNVVVAVCRGLGVHAMSRDAKAVFEHLLKVRQQSRREQIWQARRAA